MKIYKVYSLVRLHAFILLNVELLLVTKSRALYDAFGSSW